MTDAHSTSAHTRSHEHTQSDMRLLPGWGDRNLEFIESRVKPRYGWIFIRLRLNDLCDDYACCAHRYVRARVRWFDGAKCDC